MGREFNIPWVGDQHIIDRGVKIPWVGFNIPGIGGSICHGQGVKRLSVKDQNTMDRIPIQYLLLNCHANLRQELQLPSNIYSVLYM